jgi:hypothetical protein
MSWKDFTRRLLVMLTISSWFSFNDWLKERWHAKTTGAQIGVTAFTIFIVFLCAGVVMCIYDGCFAPPVDMEGAGDSAKEAEFEENGVGREMELESRAGNYMEPRAEVGSREGGDLGSDNETEKIEPQGLGVVEARRDEGSPLMAPGQPMVRYTS